MRFTTHFEPRPGEVEGSFDELFKAARTLLRERVSDEDQIIPTLVAAHEIGRGVQRWIDKKEEVLSKNLEHLRNTTTHELENGGVYRRTEGPRNLRVVGVVDGVLLLEREPVSAEIVARSPYYGAHESLPVRWSRLDQTQAVTRSLIHSGRGVLIRVFPHKRRAEPEEIASCYEAALSAEGVACEPSHAASTEYEFVGDCLYLLVAPEVRRPAPNAKATIRFPSGRFVSNYYDAAYREFADRLVTRKGGGPMAPGYLIPACVAFFLRASGGIQGRKEVHRLLNRCVLSETPMRLSDANTSEVVQLWRNERKAGEQIKGLLDRI